VLKSLEKYLPDLLNFYAFPKRLWKKLRTTSNIEPCFVEVRRRTRKIGRLRFERELARISH
jgi:transposase-like protein